MEDDVPESVKRERLERLNELQRAHHRRALRAASVGRETRAIDRPGRRAGGVEARTVWQADDIDGITLLRGADGRSRRARSSTCAIDDVVDDVRLRARRCCASSSAPAAAPARRARGLPIAAGASIGSFGR